jgi:hypothetical protein
LANILEDEPGMPKYNLAKGNTVLGGGEFRIAKDAETGISVVNK